MTVEANNVTQNSKLPSTEDTNMIFCLVKVVV